MPAATSGTGSRLREPRASIAASTWPIRCCCELRQRHAAAKALPTTRRDGRGTAARGVQQFMGPRYAEGYVKGVHDHDAAHHSRGAARDASHDRAAALLAPRPGRWRSVFWQHFGRARASKALMPAEAATASARSADAVSAGLRDERRHYVAELVQTVLATLRARRPELFDAAAGRRGGRVPVPRTDISRLHGDVAWSAASRSRPARCVPCASCTNSACREVCRLACSSVQRVSPTAASSGSLATGSRPSSSERDDRIAESDDYVDEVAALLLSQATIDATRVVDGRVTRELDGHGRHAPGDREGGRYQLHFNRFMTRLSSSTARSVPRFATLSRS